MLARNLERDENKMKMTRLFAFGFLVFALLGACKKHKENKIEPDKEYVRYVDSDSIDADVTPLDMVRTPDDGYLILGSSPRMGKQYHKVYFLKVTKEGEFQWEVYLPDQYLNPVSELIWKDGAYHLFCMNESTATVLLRLNESEKTVESIKSWPSLLQPLHCSATPDGGFLILNVDLGDKFTGISKVNNGLGMEWSEQYYFEDIFAIYIQRHVWREGSPLPFTTGVVRNGNQAVAYYFSAVVESNFSTFFVSPANGKADGMVQIDGGGMYAKMNTILPLGGDNFSFSHHDRMDNNFLVPLYKQPLNGVLTPTSKLRGQTFPEMQAGARIVSSRCSLAGRDVVLFATNTKSKGVAIYAYDAGSGEYLGSKSFSLETPMELGDLVPASDGGMMVMSKTYMASRFARMCLWKLSEEEVKKMVAM